MLYGRSFYGGPQYPRQVTAEGTLTCAASCGARSSVGYRLGGGTAALGSVAQATAVRVCVPSGSAAAGAQVPAALAKAQFRPGTVASCTALAIGIARALFSPAVLGTPSAAGTAKVRRTLRVGSSNFVRCTALAIVDGDVFALADPEPAICSAQVFGTYWFVANVAPQPDAQATGSAQRIRPVSGSVSALAVVAPRARIDATAAECGCDATAAADLDPLLTAAGVRYWDARGVAKPSASMVVEPYTYSVALSVGRAALVAAPNARRPVSGHSACTGGAAPIASETVMPQVGQIVVGADAVGAVMARVEAYSRAQVGATGALAARAMLGAAGRVSSLATATVITGAIELPAKGACGVAASASAYITRDILASGVSGGAARASTSALTRASVRVASTGLMQAQVSAALHPKINTDGEAFGTAGLSGAYRMAHRLGGSADAEALVSAANLVNDALQALSTRLLVVAAQPRLMELVHVPRVVEVSPDARRMAA